MEVSKLVRRLTGYAGVVAALVAVLSIGGAIALAPWFSLTGNALSDLGRRSMTSSPVFNGGVTLAGALGAVFVGRLAVTEGGAATRLGQLLLLLSTLSLSGIGLVPAGDPSGLHGPLAVAFFVLLTYGLAVYGTGAVLAERQRSGLLFVWLAFANVTGWAVYAVVAAGSSSAPGVALPELVGAVGLGVWAVVETRRLRDREGTAERGSVSAAGR